MTLKNKILIGITFTLLPILLTSTFYSFAPPPVIVSTGDPNECWFENENGELEPCVIESNKTGKLLVKWISLIGLMMNFIIIALIFRDYLKK